MLVRYHSTATIVGVSISGLEIHTGILVSNASAYLQDCNVSDSIYACVTIGVKGTGRLKGCMLSKSQRDRLRIDETGDMVEAIQCKVLQNAHAGIFVNSVGHLTAKGCASSENLCFGGYHVSGQGSAIELTGSMQMKWDAVYL